MDQQTEQQSEKSSEQVSAPTQRQKVALSAGRGGILGIKAGMTQVFTENGDNMAVTVIDLRPNVVTQLKTKEKDGYQAVQVGMLERKAGKASKPEGGHAKASQSNGFYYFQEFRLNDGDKLDGVAVGSELSTDFIKAGDYVDLRSISKGKGFQGGMKRFHMAGGPRSHGASVSHRSLGSIGNRADPAKCFKNKKMAGQMGRVWVTVQNVKVVSVDAENGLLLVHGSVPGPKSSVVAVRKAVKDLE